MKILGFFILLVIILAPITWAGAQTSIGGVPSGATPSSRSSGSSAIGGSAIGGSRTSMEPRRSTGEYAPDSDTALRIMAKKYENAVGVVVFVGLVGTDGPIPFGTAWALGPSLFATNSHISRPVKTFLKNGGDVFISINKTKKRLRVIEAVSHPRYKERKRNYEGKKGFSLSYDVGLLKIEGKTSNYFPLADINELKKVDSGYRIAFLGFPTEGYEETGGSNINLNSPLATMQSGIITTVSDYWLGDGGFENNLLLRHNMGAHGGASGSPLFNIRGEVVGILNAGTLRRALVRNTDGKIIGELKRSPSAIMINYAQRVDLLKAILP
jgi:hypothetical protein